MKSTARIDQLFEDKRHFLEKSAFGVCRWIGEKCNIDASRIRLYFIYASFITFGSPVVLYLVVAFWLNIKKYVLTNPARILLKQ